MLIAIAFYLFSAVLIASALMVVASRNPVHSVLFLILAFFNAAGLFVLLGAEFIAMILVIVYVGAVAVLFLFVVMMLDVDFAELKKGALQYLPIGGMVGLLLLAELLFAASAWLFAPSAHEALAHATPAGITNTAALGRILYTDYVLYFQVAGADPARRHDRRYRAHPAPPARRAPPVHRAAERARSGRGHGHSRSQAGGGRLMIGLSNYLAVAAILFTIGVFGIFLNRKNVIVILMSIELILLAVNINFVAFSSYLGDLVGQVFALFILTVAAAEAAIGLAILVIYFRNRGSIAVEDVNLMKG